MKTKAIIKPEQGKRLKNCLKRMGKTGIWLAENAFLSQQYISRIINGKAPLSAENVDRFSKLLNVRPEYLLLESDYMTEEDRITAICGNNIEIETACINLIELLGYKIIDTEKNSDGNYVSIHRDYKKINVLMDDTPERILHKVDNTPPIRVYIFKNPLGQKKYIEQDKLYQIIKSISDYANLQCETIFKEFNNHFLK